MQGLEETSCLADRVLGVILELRNAPAASAEAPGRPAPWAGVHAEKIASFIRAGRPVELVLPAFPAKSSNPEKTLGTLPDYGEVLALQRLDRLCLEIGEIYPPGARLVICSDGRVFSDLVQVRDEAVSEYGLEIRRIISEYGLARLSVYNLDDAFPASSGYDGMRRALVGAYAEPMESVRRRMKSDPESGRLFDGIHRFLFEDLLVLKPEWSRSRSRAVGKALAYSVIQRSNAWSGLVQRMFSGAVRLSIHPQPPHSAKIGVRLLPSSNIWRTPWHAAALFDGRQYSLVRRKEAEEMRAVLVKADGRYPYFMLPQSRCGGVSDATHAFH